MLNRILAAAGLAALTLAVPACSSTPSTNSGTEIMNGTVTGAPAVTGPNGPTVPLTLTGPVATTSSFTPPGGNGTRSVVTFRTPDGNLVVSADAPDANKNPAVSPVTCLMQQTIHATYAVTGATSTGKFKDATGSGTAAFSFTAYAPKLKNGTCNDAENAQPLPEGAVVTFTASGPLTVKT